MAIDYARPMRTRLAFGLAFLSLTACPSGDKSPPAPSASAVSTAPPPPAPSAKPAPSAAPSASHAVAKRKLKPPRSFEQLRAELDKKCPAKLDGNNLEMKEESEKASQCVKKRMIADLDTVLLPLKSKDPDRFHALMKEQADWNRFIESACFIEEERMWVDFDTGERQDGTMRSLGYLGCMSSGLTERELYARELSTGGIAALVKRIEERQADGAKVKIVIANIAAKVAGFVKTPPPKSPDAVSEADFPRIQKESEAMQTRTVSLAAETCNGWPDLAKALGGKDACLQKAELYYYVQGNAPDAAP